MRSRDMINKATVMLFVCASAACSPKYYVPNSHNVPMLRHQGDVSVVLATGQNPGEVQAAYAVTPRVGVLINGAFARPNDDEDGDGGEGDFLEIGLVFFESLSGPWSLRRTGCWETLGVVLYPRKMGRAFIN